MRFTVLGSEQSAGQLAVIPEFCGSLAADSLPLFASQANLEKLRGIDFLFVELSPPYLHALQSLGSTLATVPVAYYEFEEDTVKANTELIDRYWAIMANYFKVQGQTQGQIGYLDAAAIVINSLKHIRNRQLKKVLAMEVGSWTGCSSFFLASAINSPGMESGTLYCLDTWRGNKFWNYDIAAHIDIFANFRGYMTCYGTYGQIVPMVGESALSYEVLKDDCFDIIFIDGDHRYQAAYNDIRQAVKKIKPGGMLMGHDGRGYSAELPRDFLQANLDEDCAFYNGLQYSCGVLKALEDAFGADYAVFNGSSTWYHTVTEEDKKRLL